jgi:gliding motility-associated-like protein
MWDKYNPLSAKFEFFLQESITGNSSIISQLVNGCYRATITQGTKTETHRAWVFNNWVNLTTSVTESNCESFKLNGSFAVIPLKYNDLSTNTEKELVHNINVQWYEKDKMIASVINPVIFNPPPRNTSYTFRANDRFGCIFTQNTEYKSIVTEAAFSIDPKDGEAPLDVTFKNESENGDAGSYEWFFFRDIDDIKRESENSTDPIDSIMLVAYDDNPIFTFENSGMYKVKLVSKKISEFHTCVDTFYLPEFIKADTSFVAVPNVFTPNGDGTNDLFVVKFWSMQNISIMLFNRWGKRIHYWESNDIRGFKDTYTETVWDGKIGGRYASPGVYYYVVEGIGRDGAKRRERGFFHLFREK